MGRSLDAIIIGVLLAFSQAAHAQLTSLSPDLIVNCPGGGNCTIQSASPVTPPIWGRSAVLDQTYVAQLVLRSCTAKVCPNGMSDTIASPTVIGANQTIAVCPQYTQDRIGASAPVIDGKFEITVIPGQCVIFNSDGTDFVTLLTWPAPTSQVCPAGTHMVSAVPFQCS